MPRATTKKPPVMLVKNTSKNAFVLGPVVILPGQGETIDTERLGAQVRNGLAKLNHAIKLGVLADGTD